MPKQMTQTKAREILSRCVEGNGQLMTYSFFALSWGVIDRLVAEAKAYGYRAPRNASGSTARYFHAFLQRRGRLN